MKLYNNKHLNISIIICLAVLTAILVSTKTPFFSGHNSPIFAKVESDKEILDITPLPYETKQPCPAPEPTATAKPIPPLSPEEEKLRAVNREELSKQIDAYVKNDPAWKEAKVGIYISTVLRGDIIYEQNPNLPMIPASNLKMVTASAALSLLGPDYQFETSVWGSPINKETGVMKGNVYLEGTGDPTFMEPFMDNPTEVLHSFARSLKKQGVKVIEGDVVGDDTAFDREYLGRGWKSRYLLEEYAAPAGALSINANCIRLVIGAGKASMLPGNEYIQLIYDSSAGGKLYVDRKLGTDRISVKGYNSGTVYRNLTVNNPSAYTTAVFAKVLKVNGIQIKGIPRLLTAEELDYKEETTHIARYKSIPLHKIVREINKESDNICAQHVFKAIGLVIQGQGTCDNSNLAIKNWLGSQGVDTSCFAMADGSGLSVYNRITPRQMVELLRIMVNNPHWEYFWSSLPAGGVDGTLVYRFHGLPVRAKTGGLKGHIALSGYVKTKTGQLVAFSIITNAHKHWGDRIRQNEDSIVELIARYNHML
ncbi:MAG: D-alanyl-D-alanine carboxypeptidase/D-alanyl-D-alanine-endopeptidase [Vulcanimicrobiota bacterium]